MLRSRIVGVAVALSVGLAVFERASELLGARAPQPRPPHRPQDDRIAQVDGITPANGANATEAIDEVARLVASGQVRVPIAASFSVDEIRAAVELQAGRHVHGKVVIDL